MADIQGLRDLYAANPKERFFKELFEKEEYKPVLERNCQVVLDIGALAGEFDAYIYDKAGIIYAIEPNPPYFEELNSNVHEFGLTKVIPCQLAIAGHDGEILFSSGGARGGNRITDAEGEDVITVPCLTLASFMKKYHITHVNVLKIDIENGEDTVFRAPDFLEVINKIDYIIGEHINSEIEKIFLNNGFRKLESYEGNVQYERV